jgi:hypothetical protein
MSPEVAQMRSAAMSAIWSLSGEKQMSHGPRVFVDAEVIRGRRCNNWRGTSGKKQHFVPAHNPRALICYCVRNLYVTIRATMLAKISSAARDFRIIGPVELRAADEAG